MFRCNPLEETASGLQTDMTSLRDDLTIAVQANAQMQIENVDLSSQLDALAAMKPDAYKVKQWDMQKRLFETLQTKHLSSTAETTTVVDGLHQQDGPIKDDTNDMKLTSAVDLAVEVSSRVSSPVRQGKLASMKALRNECAALAADKQNLLMEWQDKLTSAEHEWQRRIEAATSETQQVSDDYDMKIAQLNSQLEQKNAESLLTNQSIKDKTKTIEDLEERVATLESQLDEAESQTVFAGELNR